MIVSHKIRLRHPVQQQILQNPVKNAPVLSLFQESIGELPSQHVIMIPAVPGQDKGIKRLNTVHSFVFFQQLVYKSTHRKIHPFQLDLHNKRYLPVHHLEDLLKFWNPFVTLKQWKLLQFLVSIFIDLSRLAAGSLQRKIMEHHRHSVLGELHVKLNSVTGLHRFLKGWQ